MKYEDIALKKVLQFWFEELGQKEWFAGGSELDEKIVDRFSDIHKLVVAGEYWKHRTNGQSLLAEVIVLDQFSRNMFRSSATAFAQDPMALALSQQAIASGYDTDMTKDEKMFLYMPFMHSESKVIHEAGLPLFESLENEETFKFAKVHKDIIDRFGRYPHRNEQLGRESTQEEKEYLENNQESFFAS